MNEVENAKSRHSKAIKDYERAVNELAEAQFELDVTYGAALAVERRNDTPVTIIDKVVRAIPEVAELRRDVAIKEGFVKSSNARVQATYLDWKHAKDYEDRDWMQSGMGAYGA